VALISLARRSDERKAALQRTCSFHNISEDGASIGNQDSLCSAVLRKEKS